MIYPFLLNKYPKVQYTVLNKDLQIQITILQNIPANVERS